MPKNNSRAKSLAKALRVERNKRIALELAYETSENNFIKTLDQLTQIKGQADKDRNRVNQLELEARANVRKSLDLQYTEINAEFPILWVTSKDAAAVNHGTYAQIKDMLSRLAPSIESIIFTYGDIKIWELTDKDLEKIGLGRIVNHSGGCIGKEAKKLEAGNG